MKKHKFHLGSFLIGLLVGGLVLAFATFKLVPASADQSSHQLQKKNNQFQLTTPSSFKKAWSQVQLDLKKFQQQTVQKIFQPVSNWFNKSWKGVSATLRNPFPHTCLRLSWLNQAKAHLLTMLGIHSQPWNLPACLSV